MSGDAFEAATGEGPAPPPGAAARRAADVRVAFDGLLQIRRLTGTRADGLDAGGPGARAPVSLPAAWERARPVRAVALALEAGGITPSAVDEDGRRTATGYRVSAADRQGAVLVEWLGPPGSGAAQEEEKELGACARVLEALGWEALLYRGPRKRRFLEVEPLREPGP